MRGMLTCLLSVALLLGAAATARADERSELKERFKERYPTLVALKKAGKVGETYLGLAAVVKKAYADDRVDSEDDASPTVAVFLAEENRDRQRLYELLAEEVGTTARKVAERDAKRRFEQARPYEWLQPEKDKWVRKREMGGGGSDGAT